MAAVLVLTTAIGIAVVTSAFGLVNAIWFRSTYPEADRLVLVHQVHPRLGESATVSPAAFERWRDYARSFDTLGAFAEESFSLTAPAGAAERVRGVRLSPEALPLLGATPLAGRLLRSGDAAGNAPPVVLVSQRFCEERFGATSVVGRTLRLDGMDVAIAGVLPYHFKFLNSSFQVFAPLSVPRVHNGERTLQVIGRLKPGVGKEQAGAEMTAMAGSLDNERPADGRGWQVRVRPLDDVLWSDARPLYLLLLVLAALLLLLVCANASNLLLALAVTRQREFAIRLAVGAGRSGLVRQLLTEALLLAGVSGILGFLVCVWLRHLLVASYPEMSELQIDARVFAFAFGCVLAATSMFAIVPAAIAWRTDPDRALRAGPGSIGRARLGRALAIAQLAIAAALLTGCGLLVKSAFEMRALDAGFRTENVLVGSVTLSDAGRGDPARRAAFYQEVLRRLERVPGVAGAAAADRVPLDGGVRGLRIEMEGRPASPGGDAITGSVKRVTAAYFTTLGVAVVAGNGFTAAMDARGSDAAIVNRTLAAALWRDQGRAVGSRIRLDGGQWRTVVGVAADVRQVLTEPAVAEVYIPLGADASAVSFVARTTVDPMTVAPSLRAAVRDLDPDVPLFDVCSMRAIVNSYFPAPIAGAFAGLAVVSLLLGSLGLYGVTAFHVARRRHEFGIRIALGAEATRIARLVLADGVRLAGLGLMAGSCGSVLIGLALSRQFFAVRPADPLVFCGVAVVLTGVALVSCAVPARRATRVAPAESLRVD